MAGSHSSNQQVWRLQQKVERLQSEPQAQSRGRSVGIEQSFKTSKPPTPGAYTDALPSARPHLLDLSKQSYQVGTKWSNIRVCGGQSHPNYHILDATVQPLCIPERYVFPILVSQ